MSDHAILLDLLVELQSLDRVPRMGYALRGVTDPESVSEHCFHLAFMVWALAMNEPEVDTLRAVELALVHDLAEVRTGDLPRTVSHHFPADAKKIAERAISAELLAPLGEEALARVDEYQTATSAEARFVKACDELQVRIKALSYARTGAGGLDEFWDRFDRFAASLPFTGVRCLAESIAARRPSA